MANIAIFINTPAQFHFYRNIADRLIKNGNEVIMLFRNYGETVQLAKEYGLNPVIFSNKAANAMQKITSFPKDLFSALRILKKFKPDLITGFGLYEGYSSLLTAAKSVVFNDSEPRSHRLLNLQYRLFMPFTDALITPSSFLDNLGNKQIRVNSYKELAYLHPNYYTPNDDIYEMLGLSKGDEYAILRFNAFDAVHDLQVSGFSSEQKLKLVETLSRYVEVFVSAEGKVPKKIERNLLNIPKRKIHDLLYHAKLFLTDTQTMATEAAILGTPTIRSNIFVHQKREMGNFFELERKYGLLFNIGDRDKAISLAEKLVTKRRLKEEWMRKKALFLKDKIDIVSFMTWFIDNYPKSCKEMIADPTIQFRFR